MTVSQDKAKERIKTVLTSGSDWQIARALRTARQPGPHL